MRWRVMWRQTHDDTVEDFRRQISNMQKFHQRELEDQRKHLAQMVEQFYRLEWSRNPLAKDHYILQIALSPEIIHYHGFLPERRHLELLADMITSQVKHEIVTTKFIRSAAADDVSRRFRY